MKSNKPPVVVWPINSTGENVAQLPIRTERLLLRDFHANDWSSVHSYAADPEVVRFVEWGPSTESDSKAFVDQAIQVAQKDPRLDFHLAVLSIQENSVIGAASIHISNPLHREAWIGYCLNKGFWGFGLATEAAKALISFGFTELGLHRIFATVDPANKASVKVLQKIGMSYEGRFKSHKLVRGVWRDTEIYAVVESDQPDSI